MRLHPRTDSLIARVLGRPGEAARITPDGPTGLWLSADGTVRLDIHTDGTYEGRVAGRKRRAHGTYRIDGGTMTLSDDSGLFTPVALREGELEMAGHRLEPAGHRAGTS